MDNSEKITNDHDFQAQFHWDRSHWFKNMDFINWIRFFFIIKEIEKSNPNKILEVGEGSGIIRKVMSEYAETYDTLDINDDLHPTYIGDVRNRINELEGRYDCIIAADILEHIPFEDLKTALENFYSYLRKGGSILITIPHRASNFFFMSPTNIPRFFRIQTGLLSMGAFYRRFIKRKIWIDPNHEWEIGDGAHSIKDVEQTIREAGLSIEARKTLFYVDFWILKK